MRAVRFVALPLVLVAAVALGGVREAGAGGAAQKQAAGERAERVRDGAKQKATVRPWIRTLVASVEGQLGQGDAVAGYRLFRAQDARIDKNLGSMNKREQKVLARVNRKVSKAAVKQVGRRRLLDIALIPPPQTPPKAEAPEPEPKKELSAKDLEGTGLYL